MYCSTAVLRYCGTAGVVSVLTVEEEAGVLDAQSVGGHAGVVPIILLRDVGDDQDGAGTQSLDVEGLAAGEPGQRVRGVGWEVWGGHCYEL